MGESTDFLALAERYLELEEHPDFRSDMKRVLEDGNADELKDRFYRDLEFGTGGLRGVIGAGFNRINPYTIRRATRGLVRYIEKSGAGKGVSVVIAHDSRRYSREFAESAALVCAASGVKAFLFESLRPTPLLSFAVRHLGATAGIVVTASHNPPEYNGYKVYWSDGAQIVPPHDSGIIDEVLAVSGPIASLDRRDAVEKGLFKIADTSVDDAFVSMVTSYLHRSDLVRSTQSFSVVYTPLHGTGTMLIERIFDDVGIRYETVPEQREPDGEFPTVSSPNPEEGAALAMAIELAANTGADLVMGTDPDADRLGVAARDGETYVLLTGNQLGSLLADYLFRTLSEIDRLPDRPVLIKTIVTTELQRRIAESYGAKVYDVLTGFKYIGEKIRAFEQTGENYVFGGEESYGYLVETEVRDKDSISAALLTAEMSLWARTNGMGLVDYLDDIYSRFGFFEEILLSTKFEGADGVDTMKALIERLRTDPPDSFGGFGVIEILDYQRGTRRATAAGGEEYRLDFPQSNVLQFRIPGGIVTVRPSGTEPKIKFYASCWEEPSTELDKAKRIVGSRIETIRDELVNL